MAEYIIDKEALMKELDKAVELADDWKTAHEIANIVRYFPAVADGRIIEVQKEIQDLKPCPFCGGDMMLCGSSQDKKFIISHKNLRSCYFFDFEIDWQTVNSLADAAKAWNRRVYSESKSKTFEDTLRDMVRDMERRAANDT